MAKAQGLTTYNIDDNLTIKCWWENTSYGFRHLAQLVVNGSNRVIEQSKATYYNRTWEEYDYQSVIHALIDKSTITDKQTIKKQIDDKALGRVNDSLKTVGLVMALGDIFGGNQKETNDWQERMLKAGLGDSGLIMPSDWDELSEDEKTSRLNKVREGLINGN